MKARKPSEPREPNSPQGPCRSRTTPVPPQGAPQRLSPMFERDGGDGAAAGAGQPSFTAPNLPDAICPPKQMQTRSRAEYEYRPAHAGLSTSAIQHTSLQRFHALAMEGRKMTVPCCFQNGNNTASAQNRPFSSKALRWPGSSSSQTPRPSPPEQCSSSSNHRYRKTSLASTRPRSPSSSAPPSPSPRPSIPPS